jgi:hypothetical protein
MKNICKTCGKDTNLLVDLSMHNQNMILNISLFIKHIENLPTDTEKTRILKGIVNCKPFEDLKESINYQYKHLNNGE